MAELDAEGRIWYPDDTSKRPRLKRYLDEGAGAVRGDVWTDIYPLNSQAEERIGYPTQKPQALLERLIAASSNEGDVILDPFCGCGTAIEAAEALGRQWAGIDVTHIAIQIIEDRMRKSFPTLRIPVVGRPTTLDAARDLAERDKHEFQLWATWLAGGHPRGGGKKGADRGIDGDIYFRCGSQEHLHGVLSIKGGRNVGPTMVRDLAGTFSNEGAHLGIFITLTPPTAEMQKAANAAGIFRHGDFVLPRLQIVTVEQLLAGIKTVQLPAYDTVAAAEEGRREIRRGRKRRKPDPRQREIAYVFENRGPAEVYEEAISPEIEPVLAQIPVFMAKSVRHQPNGMARARGGRKTTKRTA
jgi:site-specific DNA-methyltransferase (adenine-specific)